MWARTGECARELPKFVFEARPLRFFSRAFFSLTQISFFIALYKRWKMGEGREIHRFPKPSTAAVASRDLVPR